MEDSRTFSGSNRFPMSHPHAPPAPNTTRATDFARMQLVLVPTGMTIDVKKPDLVMGRHSTTDICLPLADVSRRHCRLLWLEGHWHIIDLGSLNGTMVNDRRIDQAILKHGDHVRVGSFVLEVRFPDATTMTEPLRPTRKAS